MFGRASLSVFVEKGRGLLSALVLLVIFGDLVRHGWLMPEHGSVREFGVGGGANEYGSVLTTISCPAESCERTLIQISGLLNGSFVLLDVVDLWRLDLPHISVGYLLDGARDVYVVILRGIVAPHEVNLALLELDYLSDLALRALPRHESLHAWPAHRSVDALPWMECFEWLRSLFHEVREACVTFPLVEVALAKVRVLLVGLVILK